MPGFSTSITGTPLEYTLHYVLTPLWHHVLDEWNGFSLNMLTTLAGYLCIQGVRNRPLILKSHATSSI